MANSSLVHYGFPLLRWSFSLPTAGGEVDPAASRHNAVQMSPDDERLYVTTSVGSLYIIKPEDGSVAKEVVVKAFEDGWVVRCESGVSFYDGPQGNFLVYAVADIPPIGSNETVQSRIISIRHPTGSRQWISKPIPGIVSGTPAVGSDGSFVYFTHNTHDSTEGHFTILFSSDGGVFFTEPSVRRGVGAPYAPIALTHRPVGGNFKKGAGNTNDLAIWGCSSDAGRASEGTIFAFQLPVGFSNNSAAGLQTIALHNTTWSTTSKPILSDDGQSLYFSVSKAGLRGWQQKWFNRPASWKLELTKSPDSNLQPLFATASLSRDGKMLFSASASTSFHAIDAESGKEEWSVSTYSDIVTQAILSPDGEFVYTVERGNGKVTSYNVIDGTTQWSADCTDFHATQFCQYSVEADFSVSSDGYYLYYGDIHGTITALSVGYDPQHVTNATDTSSIKRNSSESTQIGTASPTFNPSFEPSMNVSQSFPSISPSAYASQDPTTALINQPTFEPTSSPNLAQPSPEPSGLTQWGTAKPQQQAATSPPTKQSMSPSPLPTQSVPTSVSEPRTITPSSVSDGIYVLDDSSSGHGGNAHGSSGSLSSENAGQNQWIGAPVEVIVVTSIVVASAFVFFALLTAFIVRLHINHRRKGIARTLEISAETDAEHAWQDDDDGAIFSRVSC